MRVFSLEDSAADRVPIEHCRAEAWPDCEVERGGQRAHFESALARGHFDLNRSDFARPGFAGLTSLPLAPRPWPEKPYALVAGTPA